MTPGGSRKRIGEFEILAQLKSGGMGEVYLVRRIGVHGFERLAAVKVIRRAVGEFEHLRAMFRDEARLMGRISHPAIAQVYDFGEDSNRLFLVMEYVSGITFSKLILLRPPPVIAARAVSEVCQGLHAAHELADFSGRPLGVVHRDVSPQNLMLTFDGYVKILDFGIAMMRDRESQATQIGQIKGKPSYMAPEQVTGKPVDRRTDVFTTTVVLYELLTGRRLFGGDTIAAIAMGILKGRIPPPSSLVGPLPSGMDDLVMRGLQRNPARRFQTTLELAQALTGVVASTRGETLEQYAPRELDQDRLVHLERLQQILSGEEAEVQPPAFGRPAGVSTALIDLGAQEEEKALERGATVVTIETGEAIAGNTRRSPLKVPLVLGLMVFFLVAGAVAIGLLWWTGRQPSDDLAGAEVGQVLTGAGADQSVKPPGDERPAEPDEMPGLDLGEEPEDPKALAGETEVPKAVPEKTRPKPVRKRLKRTRRKRSRSSNSGQRGHAVVRTTPKDPLPPDPEKAVASKSAFGFVTVAANPYAIVRIDGKQVGTTPIFRRKLPVGSHEITLVNPATGKVRTSRKVSITEGGLKKVIVQD